MSAVSPVTTIRVLALSSPPAPSSPRKDAVWFPIWSNVGVQVNVPELSP